MAAIVAPRLLRRRRGGLPDHQLGRHAAIAVPASILPIADSFDDVIGIDVGITLLSAENLRTGNVWKWFGANPEIRRAMSQLFTP